MKRAIVILMSVIITLLFFSSVALSKTKNQTLKLESNKGIKFKADYYKADKASSPAVLILPGMSGKRDPYKRISKELNNAGFNVIAINYYKLDRGYDSHRERKKVLEKRGGTIGIVENEVTASLDFLSSQESVDFKRIGILGGSMGTWVGLQAMARFNNLKSLAMLSPTCAVSGKSFRTYEGTLDLVKAFGKRCLFLVGSEKDRHSSEFPTAVEKSEYLISIMPNAKIEKKYYPGKSHSYFMLEDHPDLPELIIKWFQETL